MKTYLTNQTFLRIETDPEVIATLERKGWVNNPPPPYDPETQTATFDGEWHITTNPLPEYTAEAWLQKEGYGPIQLLTLLDLENKLAALNLDSSALTAVRAWANSLLASYVADPTPRTDWPPAPHTFAATVAAAYQLL